MALLELKDIGKIYVSDGSVAVGIRGVNLSFDSGEFVAVTGKSGSGKSTLLSIISGMDSYEEGELFIDGEPTSHYLQPEWEEYRQKYISFIFQDYNIIESFTVLENVELALMHIEDKKARRARALELIERVGLSSHVKHKGSKLSGGQKQRTVIARALAKDSPIILADEPTGNLDAESSKEIIGLLYEVSRDKLLIVVTHNFDEVEKYATRHIRIFDGAVESDKTVAPNRSEVVSESKNTVTDRAGGKKRAFLSEVKNGITLGRSIFAAKPKLSVFLCILMIVGTLGVYALTALYGLEDGAFGSDLMFTHIDGRVVVTRQNGAALSEDEVLDIKEKYGAVDYMRFDVLLDNSYYFRIPNELNEYGFYDSVELMCTYGEDFGDDIVGRYPEAADEVLLYLPISYKPQFGTEQILIPEIVFDNMALRVAGVKYYYDNNLTPKCLFTDDGFRVATAAYYIQRSSLSAVLSIETSMGNEYIAIYNLLPCFELDGDEIYIDSQRYEWHKSTEELEHASLDLNCIYYSYNYWYSDGTQSMTFARSFDETSFVSERPNINDYGIIYGDYAVVSDELLVEMAEEMLDGSYKQISLFFENDKEARLAAETMQDDGYIAVPSDTMYTPDAEEALLQVILNVAMIAGWTVGVLFLSVFVYLCSGKALDAFKGDMAIMRSMGIQVKVIRIGMYVRMLISLIPSFLIVGALAVLIYTTPAFNGFFKYLYLWQYALIFVGMLLLTVFTTHKQIKRLFGTSVKKSLKGGAAND